MTAHDAAVRPWGSWRVLHEGDGFKVKQITVEPGHRLSYQTHAHRSESWTVVAGVATCVLDGAPVELGVGESVTVAVGQAHRLGNVGSTPLVVVEVQLGSYTGEDDICRLADDYGRFADEAQ